jgi:hypothetical protein
MKQIWPNYSYSPATNVLTLTGLNIDRDQLLLVTAADRGRIIYNFADSSVTASAFTSGANTALTLVATTAGLTTTAALVIYYDDQVASNSVTVSSLPAISGTVTANLGSAFLNTSGGYQPVQFSTGLPVANEKDGITFNKIPFLVEGSVTIGSALPTGTNRIGVVTIGAGTVTLGASTAQIGSVTAAISGTVSVSGTFFQATQPVSLTTLPALVAGTAQIGSVTVGNTVTIAGTVTANPTGTQTIAGSVTLGASTSQIGSVTASISGTVPVSISSVTVGNSVTIGSLPTISGTVTANTFALQGTAVTTSNFTSTTASTVLANFNATREVLTIFNEGAGNLHICAGATCTTIAYQVRLSAGDYYEVPNHQTSLTHSAVFATAGTARVAEVS